MPGGEGLRQARLDALVGIRAELNNDVIGMGAAMSGDGDIHEVARAAMGFAAALLSRLPRAVADRWLDGLTTAAIGPNGERP